MIFYLAPPELIAVSLGGIAGIVVTSKLGGKFIQKYSGEQQKWTAAASKAGLSRKFISVSEYESQKKIFVIFQV